jgi:hypothetical protein
MAGLVEILNDSPIEHPKQAAFGFDEYSRALTSIILDAKSHCASLVESRVK